MAAHVEHRFKKGFLLDEEKFRKLVNIISQRLSKSTPPIVHKFRVFRADSYSYETNNIEDVVNEDNADWRRITRLQIEASHEKEFEFDLTFSDEGTSLKLDGDDRDQVYLILSDLREYLKNEVNTCIHISRDVGRAISLLLPMAFSVLFLFLVFLKAAYIGPSKAEIQTVLDSQQIEQKLDFLIQQKLSWEELRFLFPALMLMPLLLLISLFDFTNKIIAFFRPSNLFLFGPQKQKYDRRRRIVSNVLWGILIAFVISVLAGITVWKMTK